MQSRRDARSPKPDEAPIAAMSSISIRSVMSRPQGSRGRAGPRGGLFVGLEAGPAHAVLLDVQGKGGGAAGGAGRGRRGCGLHRSGTRCRSERPGPGRSDRRPRRSAARSCSAVLDGPCGEGDERRRVLFCATTRPGGSLCGPRRLLPASAARSLAVRTRPGQSRVAAGWPCRCCTPSGPVRWCSHATAAARSVGSL